MHKIKLPPVNVFNSHGYVPGGPVRECKAPTRYKRGGFGNNSGTIPGMGRDVPNTPSGLAISNRGKK